jgi:hypothetical protein
MLKFQIVYPITYDIYGDSFKEAVKNYVKLKHNYDINNLIISDQQTYAYQAKLRYYMENQRNKVGIDFYPYPYNNIPLLLKSYPQPQPLITSPGVPFATSATNIFMKN